MSPLQIAAELRKTLFDLTDFTHMRHADLMRKIDFTSTDLRALIKKIESDKQ